MDKRVLIAKRRNYTRKDGSDARIPLTKAIALISSFFFLFFPLWFHRYFFTLGEAGVRASVGLGRCLILLGLISRSRVNM